MEEKNLAQNESNTSLAQLISEEGFVADLTSGVQAYCSFVPSTDEERAQLFKAMNNPEKRIGDCINMVISAKDIYVEMVDCTNKETGLVTRCPRIVIIDDNGLAYQAVSLGVYSAIKKIFQVYGEPCVWKAPIQLKVVQITKGDRKLLTFDIVAAAGKK